MTGYARSSNKKFDINFECDEKGKVKSATAIWSDGTTEKIDYTYIRGELQVAGRTTGTYTEQTEFKQDGNPEKTTKTYTDGFVAEKSYEYKSSISGKEELQKETVTTSVGSTK